MADPEKLCEHCGGPVDADGMSLDITEEPKSEETEVPPERDFAEAVSKRKAG